MKLAVIDFETKGIENRPVYPPTPVGVAVDFDGRKRYLAWGHPEGNNATKREASKITKHLFNNYNCVFHSAAFDISVACKHLGCKPPKSFEDTLFLAYLNDPREISLSLKPLAEKYLDDKPLERDLLKEWILKHIFEKNGWKESKKNPWGKYISDAPGGLVSRYAKADIRMTKGLYRCFIKEIKRLGMYPAYMREKEVMPIFNSMSDTGLKIRVSKLRKDLGVAKKDHTELARRIRVRLKDKDLDIGSKDLANAMDKAGKITEWVYTEPTKTYPQGQKSTSRDNLMSACNDKTLFNLLSRYTLLGSYISTFMAPWLQVAKEHGRIYPNFNQVRSPTEYGSRIVGTRTGRPSSTNPNLFNVPRNIDDRDKWAKGLPFMRDYIAPDDGCVLIGRDFSQQEIRILAHFEQGALYQAYLDDPTMDVHEYAKQLIKELTGISLARKTVKTIAFGIIYGMGKVALADALGIEQGEAYTLKNIYLKAFPGIKRLSKDLKRDSRNKIPMRTWANRLYWVERAKIVKGHLRTFEYKLFNYRIQGSASECTKQAMINATKNCKKSRLMLQVYDELLMSVEKGSEVKAMKELKESMESVPFTVKMLTEGKASRISWSKMKGVKDV